MITQGQGQRAVQPDDPELLRIMAQREGRVPYMYLDSEGYVTVGIGCKLESATEAAGLPFRRGASGPPVSRAEISEMWHTVKGSRRGRSALEQRGVSGAVQLPQSAIEALFRTRAKRFLDQLRRTFPQFDTYPYEAQLGLLDLAFNTGSVTVTNFPALTAAVRRRDWREAAVQSHRRADQVGKDRNEFTRQLFLTAQAADTAARGAGRP